MLPPASAKRQAEPFGTTRWTRVCLAKADSEEGRRALAELCDAYYDPVIAYLRCELRDHDAAHDMGHAFFAQMLGGNTIAAADAARGRFRSYLLGAVKHFLSHQREAAQRQKRGGGAVAASMDDDEVREMADGRQPAPDDEFDRQWALTLLRHALDELKQQCVAEGRETVFEKLQPWLTGDADAGGQAELAASLGMNVNSLKSQVHRLRQRFRALVKAEIAATLDAGGSVEAEMTVLFAALRRN